jgi:hypothetical protein
LLKCDRLLTSGRRTTVDLATENGQLANIVKNLAGKVQVIAAAGVRADNVAHIVAKTFVTAIHAGSAVTAFRGSNSGSYDLVDAINIAGKSTCVAPEMMAYQCVLAEKVCELVLAAEQTWAMLAMTLEATTLTVSEQPEAQSQGKIQKRSLFIQ